MQTLGQPWSWALALLFPAVSSVPLDSEPGHAALCFCSHNSSPLLPLPLEPQGLLNQSFSFQSSHPRPSPQLWSLLSFQSLKSRNIPVVCHSRLESAFLKSKECVGAGTASTPSGSGLPVLFTSQVLPMGCARHSSTFPGQWEAEYTADAASEDHSRTRPILSSVQLGAWNGHRESPVCSSFLLASPQALGAAFLPGIGSLE